MSKKIVIIITKYLTAYRERSSISEEPYYSLQAN